MGVDVSFTFQAQPDAPLFLAVARRAARAHAFILAAEIGLMTGYRVDDRGISISAGFDEHFHPWSEVAAVKEWTGQFAVFLGPRLASVPGRPFSVQLGRRIVSVPTGGLTGQQRSELRDLLHSGGATAKPAPTI
jgi:hypothetical protein